MANMSNYLENKLIDFLFRGVSFNAGHIKVGNNPGVATDNPSIATSKGYVIYGSGS